MYTYETCCTNSGLASKHTPMEEAFSLGKPSGKMTSWGKILQRVLSESSMATTTTPSPVNERESKA